MTTSFSSRRLICRATSARYPNLTALYSIGKSVEGRDLWVLVLSASPYEHMIGKPDVKYIGNIHGNEPVGKEMLLHMIQYMVTSYSADPYIRWLLDNTRIHILPSLNPDGYAKSKEGVCDGASGRSVWLTLIVFYFQFDTHFNIFAQIQFARFRFKSKFSRFLQTKRKTRTTRNRSR